VLLSFFSVYALISLFIFILALQGDNGLVLGFMFLLASFCIGVVIVGAIVRFA